MGQVTVESGIGLFREVGLTDADIKNGITFLKRKIRRFIFHFSLCPSHYFNVSSPKIGRTHG
jgi:hypothetical protein